MFELRVLKLIIVFVMGAILFIEIMQFEKNLMKNVFKVEKKWWLALIILAIVYWLLGLIIR